MAFIRKKRSALKTDSSEKILFTVNDLREFARDNGLNVEPIDIAGLASKLGIVVRYEPMESTDSGSLKFVKGKWILTVNSLHHPHRQRYTIAHELGHYCKHAGQRAEFADTVFFRGKSSDRLELEANRFAADLLMPREQFDNFVRKNPVVAEVAKHFMVSAVAVMYRATELGYKGCQK